MSNLVKSTLLPFIVISAFIFSGCLSGTETSCSVNFNLDNVDQSQLNQELDSIDVYLDENSIEAQIDSRSQIRYVVNENGDGASPGSCDLVVVNYTGKILSTGEVFDESENPIQFRLNNLITGWQLMLPEFNSGGTYTLYIPSVYAYGSTGTGDQNGDGIGDLIPPYTTLIFEIELLGVN